MTSNENEILNKIDGQLVKNDEPFDFDELEEKLQNQLDDSLAELELICGLEVKAIW